MNRPGVMSRPLENRPIRALRRTNMINPDKTTSIKCIVAKAEPWCWGQYIYCVTAAGEALEGFSGRNRADLNIGDIITARVRYCIMSEQYLIRETTKHRKAV